MPVRAVSVLTEAEQRQLLYGWNDDVREAPPVTLPGLFEATVAGTPDAVAVACGDAVLTYRELLCNTIATADGFGIGTDDRIYDFRSHNWCSAQVLSALAPLYRGATLILGRKFSRSRYFEHIKEHRATIAAGNPTTVNMLLNGNETRHGTDMPSLRFVTSSSAPLLVEEWQRFEERFGVSVEVVDARHPDEPWTMTRSRVHSASDSCAR